MNFIPILNIEQFELKVPMSDFYSNELDAHLEKNKNFFHKPHRHDFFLCVLFTEGSGKHEIDFNTFKVAPRSVFFLKPGQTHFWQFDSPPKGYIFFHTKDFFEIHFSSSKIEQFPFYYTQNSSPTLTLNPKDLGVIADRFQEINLEYIHDFPYKKQKISNLLNAVYIDLARHYTQVSTAITTSSFTYIETLRNLENLIEQHYLTEKNAQFYAYKLHITSRHLNRIVQATLGKTTTQLITERVILESKRLIIHSDNTLSNISELVGFNDYTYFSKVFKVNTGKTPVEFRKKYA